MLMGTMKARTLYRLTTDGDRVINREVLFKDVGRIRDIEIGADGTPFLLMEQDEGSIIVRMSIAD